jgi:hypothetical protein
MRKLLFALLGVVIFSVILLFSLGTFTSIDCQTNSNCNLFQIFKSSTKMSTNKHKTLERKTTIEFSSLSSSTLQSTKMNSIPIDNNNNNNNNNNVNYIDDIDDDDNEFNDKSKTIQNNNNNVKTSTSLSTSNSIIEKQQQSKPKKLREKNWKRILKEKYSDVLSTDYRFDLLPLFTNITGQPLDSEYHRRAAPPGAYKIYRRHLTFERMKQERHDERLAQKQQKSKSNEGEDEEEDSG